MIPDDIRSSKIIIFLKFDIYRLHLLHKCNAGQFNDAGQFNTKRK